MRDIVIFGDGDLAEIIAFYLEKDSNYKVRAFSVDGMYLKKEKLLGRDIIPFEEIENYYPVTNCSMFIALGYAKMNKNREKKLNEAKTKGYKIAKHIHSKAIVYPDLNIGENTFLFENNVVQPFVTIGSNNII